MLRCAALPQLPYGGMAAKLRRYACVLLVCAGHGSHQRFLLFVPLAAFLYALRAGDGG
jgi:hypothetical protein